ncbi:MAG TPA: histidinol dehydrogenase [Aggregatilinea sp.]|uniref:histidinol dehydrogenase n=1 Tax=Aggregatilinea sp. TaxID=2806333 RepID=UPI002C19B9E6|nr:histidinol dehydrogenase [Aggregatilinea sp.]HML22729.1 histidinol dehydrogenase [Aggregatilinea sp.]
MSDEASLLRILDLEDARGSILARHSLREVSVPAWLNDSLATLFGGPTTPEEAVRQIIRSVRADGDAALIDWAARIDGVTLDAVAVPQDDIQRAVDAVPDEVWDALMLAAERIGEFHRKQPVHGWIDATPEGSLGQLVRPVDSVGVYVAGGTAPLPSSLLMSVIPAQVAGVKEIVVCTPPGRPDGRVPDVILAAAAVCGITRIYRAGGAQAIAAMAYGTESVPRVAKIVGPGNLFTTLAKQQVFGDVGIDGLPGPTETMVIADADADPALAAADLLAQAEHDVLASAILVTPSRDLAERVAVEVGKQIEDLSRSEIIAQAMVNRSGAVIVRDLPQALEVANIYAAEHLCLLVNEPWQWIGQIRNAGGIFLGESSFEVLGDYVAGPSHVMPTGGTARYASPLNVLDFVKITSVIGLDAAAAQSLSEIAAVLARAEALTAHAAAAEARLRRA